MNGSSFDGPDSASGFDARDAASAERRLAHATGIMASPSALRRMRSGFLAAGLAAGLACLAGCAELPLQQGSDPAQGAAVQGIMAKQVINQKPASAGPMEGLDGQRAQRAMEAYRDPKPESKSDTNYSITLGAKPAGSGQSK